MIHPAGVRRATANTDSVKRDCCKESKKKIYHKIYLILALYASLCVFFFLYHFEQVTCEFTAGRTG